MNESSSLIILIVRLNVSESTVYLIFASIFKKAFTILLRILFSRITDDSNLQIAFNTNYQAIGDLDSVYIYLVSELLGTSFNKSMRLITISSVIGDESLS